MFYLARKLKFDWHKIVTVYSTIFKFDENFTKTQIYNNCYNKYCSIKKSSHFGYYTRLSKKVHLKTENGVVILNFGDHEDFIIWKKKIVPIKFYIIKEKWHQTLQRFINLNFTIFVILIFFFLFFPFCSLITVDYQVPFGLQGQFHF